MSLGADVADHISAPGLLKNSPSAQLFEYRYDRCLNPIKMLVEE